ncbi:hypothetical protein CWC46_20535 [Prodigiosinella confusarubida]|uniref:Uncharacterized protein n=1 Tax=Serratia sp. (strain ATCC 39006) TaxID=104623 RepID=A0A2I5TBN0_SERS3|nr:hypothetical protein CWC46_20535 [Serratia sp. ATCC 39006]AUH06288.1 hypothetical protein Ser39006_020530 [Serratia sp. ATCC 39006]
MSVNSVREITDWVIIRNNVFHGGGQRRMSLLHNRLKVHTKSQIRDLNGKMLPRFLRVPPQKARQC